ncbi:hypothetical protein AALO_G00224860 [Alosa alosa]|uniref:Protein downstream neighbor of Son n=1 Tax=Alosa alosa TaxID=278164 RepID=A0AAV6FY27_9TELE|nr:protein downstream neighbor of son homolog [Alosa alosa]KAG5267718.1 hypothetical protein AALO_G00224860 [Alosa alosa]
MEQAGYSPSFKKPADIMRMRRKRARSEGVSPNVRKSLSVPGTRPFSPGPSLNAPNRPGGGGQKRRNPFANIENTYNSPKKRATFRSDGDVDDFLNYKNRAPVETDGENSAHYANTTSLSYLDQFVQEAKTSEKLLETPISISKDDSLFEADLFEDGKTTALVKSPQHHAAVEETPPVSECPEYPADWSLKTRLLFTSSHAFSWAEQPKAQEEAQGLTQHCRAEYACLPQNIQDPRSCPELRCGFQQALQYWQHPSLPWLSLFPRIGAERKFAGKSSPWSQDAELQQSMMREWSVSLTSLYSLLKARLCPYFYLCSYQFTVLFRASGLSGAPGLTALLTPTTRGLREAMKADGIEFTLPLLEDKRKSKEHSDECKSAEGEDPHSSASGEHSDQEVDNGVDEDDDDDDSGFSWLKEMGVQDKIKKPDSITIKLHKERSSVCLDHKPESVVLVKGAHTHTLINFLINCKSLVAAAGSQAGLPPTLLAPSAFRGATLQTLKARSVNVKTQVRTGYQDLCSLEVTGPIMPHSLHMLTQLLRTAQKGSFSAGLYTHEPTAVLNVPVCKNAEPKEQVDVGAPSGCGLSPATLQQIVEPASLGKSALRQLHLRGYGYTWKS